MTKGYKVFESDWTCKGLKYEVGKTYTLDESIELCKAGFHFCKNLVDCFDYYPCVTWYKIAEVEALGQVKTDGNKSVTDIIKIVKEISFDDLGKILKSYGVNESNGVNTSYGVNESYGVNLSFGILNSYGVDNALFLANKKRSYSIFGEKVSQKRFNEVKSALFKKLNGWQPTFNNLTSLYLKSGSEWRLTPITKAEEISKAEAWADMPIEAIDYVKSLPEYNADMFTEITGIKGGEKCKKKIR